MLRILLMWRFPHKGECKMIKREFYRTREDGVDLYKTYSDEGYTIKQEETGNIYAEAIDVSSANYTYTETGEKIRHLEEV